MPRVPQHPPDEMPDEGATTGTSHHARLQARASASAANSYAPALDDTQSSAPVLTLDLLSGTASVSVGPRADHQHPTHRACIRRDGAGRRPNALQTPDIVSRQMSAVDISSADVAKSM